MDEKFGTDVIVAPINMRQRNQFITHERVKLTAVGEFAKSLTHSLSIAGKPDGETSTGEQKYRVYSEEEVVQRAVKLATLAFETFEKEGLVVFMPSKAELFSETDEKVGF